MSIVNMASIRMDSLLYISLFVFIFKDHLVEGKFACDPGWKAWNNRCYKYIETPVRFSEAIKACRAGAAHLWHIDSEEENEFFVDGGKGRAWVNRKYSNQVWVHMSGDDSIQESRNVYFKRYIGHLESRYRPCVTWKRSSGEWGTAECSEKRNFTCVKYAAGCVDGFYGLNCADVCHCAAGGCDRNRGVCPSGCELGWTGMSCGREKKKVEGLYYCLNTEEKGKRVIFKANQNGLTYLDVTAVDKNGEAVETCDRAAFNISPDGIASLTIHEQEKQFIPDCGAEQVSPDTVKWRFRFSEFPNTQSKYDVVFEVMCNFSNADTLQRSSDMNNGKLQSIWKTLSQSELSAGLQLIDPQSNVELLSVKVGHPVVLKLNFKQSQEDFGVIRIAPYSCTASSEDGKVGVLFLDADGCIPDHAHLRLLPTNGSSYQSLVFEAFSFPGYEHVAFSCHLEICFSGGDPLCYERCKNMRKSTDVSSLARAGTRKKRNVGIRLRVTDN